MISVRQAVERTVEWIDQAENKALQIEGYYANGGRAGQLHWIKNTLLTAPTEGVQRDLLDHWAGIGLLPPDLLGEKRG